MGIPLMTPVALGNPTRKSRFLSKASSLGSLAIHHTPFCLNLENGAAPFGPLNSLGLFGIDSGLDAVSLGLGTLSADL